MFLSNKYFAFLFVSLIFFGSLAFGQIHNNPIDQINVLISENKLDSATAQIENTQKQAANNNQNWNEGDLIYAIGKVEFLRDRSTSFEQAQNYLYKMVGQQKPDSVLYRAYLHMGLLYNEQEDEVSSQKYMQKASEVAKKTKDPFKLIETEYYLAEISLKSGDFNLLFQHTDNALNLLQSHNEIKHPLAPRIYNYKASLMYFSAKPDSANFYFEKALSFIPDTENTPENLYYLPGVIYGNWFLVKQSAGDLDAAMEFTLKCIKYYNRFLSEVPNHSLAQKVHGNLSIAYRNLGSLYNDLGFKEKAKQVASIGYVHAQNHFLPNTISYFSATLMMGEAYLYSNELNMARKYLLEAERSLTTVPGNNFFYYSNFYSVMANLERMDGNLDKAIEYYQQASDYLIKSDDQQFSQNYIFNELNLAQAYAKNNEPDKASKLISGILDKTKKYYGDDSYLANSVRTSQARIGFQTGNYLETIETCNRIIDILARKYGYSDTNYLFLQINLAEIILLRAQSKYELLTNKDSVNSFIPVLEDIDLALKQLERQKTFITSREEVADLIENNREVFEFAKKINLELYLKTREKQYLDKVIELHESSIYSRIRARLNLNENQLSLVPENIAKREKELKHKLNNFFNSNDDAEINIDSLEQAGKNWNDFLESMKQQYPKYYNLRYASILQDIGNVNQNVPKNITIVRYLFIDEKLYAYVLNGESENLYALNFSGADNEIELFKDFTTPENVISDAANELYGELWKPFEDEVTTSNVIIFPDQQLYNLSFELLTPKRINSLKELSTKSLMAKYNISYNYSLFLLKENRKAFDFNQDFVAFAPAFSDTMKFDYQLTVNDSLNLDKAYLKLLPQPFTSQLVKQIGRKYNGQSFLNENASKQLFVNKAGEHKIIHIGTHAESNNQNPELSRLVFAKNLTDSLNVDNNYLYNYEIYNVDLNSELAILSACETGKPGYQSGEGMISLAHAFNYAGSESILTSLWEIDEKSSVEILMYFYKYLQEGKRKDEALRLAKLSYIKNADGRTINPQYWAGLILMGNTKAIKFSTPVTFHILWLSIVVLVVVGIVVFLRKRLQ